MYKDDEFASIEHLEISVEAMEVTVSELTIKYPTALEVEMKLNELKNLVMKLSREVENDGLIKMEDQ